MYLKSMYLHCIFVAIDKFSIYVNLTISAFELICSPQHHYSGKIKESVRTNMFKVIFSIFFFANFQIVVSQPNNVYPNKLYIIHVLLIQQKSKF